jgi:hypothetical protein
VTGTRVLLFVALLQRNVIEHVSPSKMDPIERYRLPRERWPF